MNDDHYRAVYRHALASGEDRLFCALYFWVRGQMFIESDVDPEYPVLQAKKEWEAIQFPGLGQTSPSWTVLDNFEVTIRKQRGILRVVRGV